MKYIYASTAFFLVIFTLITFKTQNANAAFSTVDCTNGAHLTTLGGISQAECQALEDLYTNTAGTSWTTKTNWDTLSDVGTWYGVTRSGSNVTHILLSGNNLVGTLPSSISSLTGLQQFWAGNNTLSGSIPSLASNTALTQFLVGTNQFTGSIPSLTTNTALSSFYVNNNLLAGSIPSLTANTALTQFLASSNTLTGSIPSLTTNTLLVNFDLHNNQLTGSIPSLTANTNLSQFFVGTNQLTGSIPSLATNTSLSLFDVRDNQLTGSIPSLTTNTSLEYVYFDRNQLTGSIPSLSASTGLIEFYANKNALTGDIPDFSTFGSLTAGSLAENSLQTSSSAKDTSADTKFSENWSATQTVAPTGLTATRSGLDMVVSWTPVEYTSVGSYKVYSGTTSGGPYSTLEGTIARSSSATITISNVTANTYYIVQAYTPINGTQQNLLTVDSAEVSGFVSSGSSGGILSTKGSGSYTPPVEVKKVEAENVKTVDATIKPTKNATCPAAYKAFTKADLYKKQVVKTIQWLLNQETGSHINIQGFVRSRTLNAIKAYKKMYSTEIGLNSTEVKTSKIDLKTLAHMNAKLCAK